MEDKTITSEHLADDANHTQCECGNQTIGKYSWSNDSGQSCPLCMVSWQLGQIKAMKELVYNLSPKNKEETAKEINKKYAKLLGCDLEWFESQGIDFS